ncbi:MAG: glycoside hydrolase family 3 C-terminal domain-containing protein [Lachnospiraceae bacterium]|nr:glycoside hydrolase family 3 C-terminal domain-containing protein [Lachnospiraceae bacterium]
MDTKEFFRQMTVADKARLLCGTSPFSIGGFEASCGFVPELNIQDGGTGVNHGHLFSRLFRNPPEGYTTGELMHMLFSFYEPDGLTDREKKLRDRAETFLTEYRSGIDQAPGCYPPGILLGATWNPETVYETGKALGMEAAVYHIGVLLGTPNCNILREPVNGRFFEGYSEDPFLTKILAPEMCKGVESMGVASDVKHFACNNLEINRKTINELIGIRALREIYFPAFEACSKVAATLMSAYPAINGRHCMEDPWLLTEVLRKEWEYKGVTVTDWEGRIKDSGEAVAAGQDLFMPGPWDPEQIIKAVEDGRLSVSDLDAAAERILELIDRFADVKAPSDLTGDGYVKNGDTAAYNAAAEGIVMLKNNGGLPLKKTAKAVFFGPERFRDYGKGSAEVFTSRTTDLYEELSGILGDRNVMRNDIEAFRQGATAIVIETVDSGEGNDRPDLKMNGKTVSMIKKLAKDKGKGRICLILNVPGPVELDGLEVVVDSVFAVFYPGMMGARAMADILTGRVNPSGALPCTFPVSYKDTPAYLCYPDSQTCVYGEGIYVGYRGYQKRGIKPLYPFGFGLSYSKFAVKDISAMRSGDTITVSCSVSNTSRTDGKAVVQLYVSKSKPRVPRAPFQLAGFKKIPVTAGSGTEVKLSFDIQELSYYDEEHGRFLMEGGLYELFLSLKGCEDLIPAGSIYIADESPELQCGPSWTLKQISERRELTDALQKDCEELGLPYMGFVINLQYDPSTKLNELFPETDVLTNFNRAAGELKEE